jgi:hypothetical protein
MLVERRRVAEGEILLREAVNEMPRNQRLRILHAYALDTLQLPWHATEVIEVLDSSGGQQSTSPRLRYAQWPDLNLARAQAILARGHELGLPALEGALK